MLVHVVHADGELVRRAERLNARQTDIFLFAQRAKLRRDLLAAVEARDDVRNPLIPRGKQSERLHSHDCDYTRTTGIWQTVWVEFVPKSYIKSIKLFPNPESSSVAFSCELCGSGELGIDVLYEGKLVGRYDCKNAAGCVSGDMKLIEKHLWEVGCGRLYNLVITFGGDTVKSYFGLRDVRLDGFKYLINGKSVFQRLVLDQGFYRDGIYTAPDDSDMIKDIEISLAAGFNGARLHQKVFEERYYYWADRLGYITWGESPSWGMDANDVETARNFLSEWAECVVRDRNHPSLLTWTPMNEEWWPDNTQFPRFASDVYDLTGRLDPTRPVNTVSGGAVVRTDIWAVHNYEQNPAKLKEKIFSDGTFFHPRLRTTRDQTRNIGFNEVKATANYAWPQYDGSCPYLVDEFGGIKWVKDQEKQATDSQTESWGYGQAPRTLEEFYTRLEGQVDALLSLSGQVWGYCYTQLTDVEQEQNGIYCYDRSAKFAMDRIKAIFSKRPEHPAR